MATTVVGGVGFGVVVFLVVVVERLAQRVAHLEGVVEQLVKRVNGNH